MQIIDKFLKPTRLPLDVFYVKPHKPTFEHPSAVYVHDPRSHHERDLDFQKLQTLIPTVETGA